MIDDRGLWVGGKCPWWRPHKWKEYNNRTFDVDNDKVYLVIKQCTRCGWPGARVTGVRGDWRPDGVLVVDDYLITQPGEHRGPD